MEETFAVSGRFTLWRSGLFPLPFLAMSGYMTWRVLAHPDAVLIVGLLSAQVWEKWLLLATVDTLVVYLAWGMFRLKAVVLIGDRVLVKSFLSEVELPLSAIVDAVWIQKPVMDYTPVAELVLSEPCAFGDRIRFEPRSAKAFEHLVDRMHIC